MYTTSYSTWITASQSAFDIAVPAQHNSIRCFRLRHFIIYPHSWSGKFNKMPQLKQIRASLYQQITWWFQSCFNCQFISETVLSTITLASCISSPKFLALMTLPQDFTVTFLLSGLLHLSNLSQKTWNSSEIKYFLCVGLPASKSLITPMSCSESS